MRPWLASSIRPLARRGQPARPPSRGSVHHEGRACRRRCAASDRHRAVHGIPFADVSIRVILAEDDFLVREGIRRVLEAAPDVTVVGEYADGDAVLAAVDADPPDVVVTDVRMPPSGGDEGIRIANRLRTSHPAVAVLVLSQFADPEYALALLEEGSERRAYLLKERVHDRRRITHAIRDVAAGGSTFD